MRSWRVGSTIYEHMCQTLQIPMFNQILSPLSTRTPFMTKHLIPTEQTLGWWDHISLWNIHVTYGWMAQNIIYVSIAMPNHQRLLMTPEPSDRRCCQHRDLTLVKHATTSYCSSQNDESFFIHKSQFCPVFWSFSEFRVNMVTAFILSLACSVPKIAEYSASSQQVKRKWRLRIFF